MKKILTLCIALLAGYSVQATHLMGGELTVEHIGGNDYVIHFTAYRDTLGIPFATTAQFDVYDSSYTYLFSSTTSQFTNSGSLLPGYPYGVETYFFIDTISVSGPGTYHVSWTNCCRNGAIQNLTDPLAENMFLTTTFTNIAGAANSTPVFLAPPVTFLPINQPWQYNSLPFDIDGDSMTWSIDTPLTAMNAYCTGWLTPSAAAPADAFTIDPVTGEISWTPDALGNFVASILVEEFRSGQKIGEIRRDYQMIVIPDTNKCPVIVDLGNIPRNAQGYSYLRTMAGVPLNVTLHAEDPEGDPVEFVAFGEPFLLPQHAATFTTQAYHTTNKVGTFSWTPSQAQVRNKPYIVVFRVRDNIFSGDNSVLIYVDRNPSLGSPSENFLGELYPNPAPGPVVLPFTLKDDADVSFSVFGITGSKVYEKSFGYLPKGQYSQELMLNLSAGTYFVRMVVNGNNANVQRLIIGSGN
ncbi:MAG TPA: T9SS type A sorting domain-containing protein [Bacteroidia bacterium]|nr:T9SS type A sorting domain-containing protein [Bacteroidia bacterium]